MTLPVETPEHAELAAEVLKAIAHPLRLRIVSALSQQPLNVGQLAERLGAQQAIVSQQLRILRMRNLVGVTRANGYATYRLAQERLEDVLGCLAGCVCPEGDGTS